MPEPPKEFLQTGADGHGQISPPMGEFWLPHGNSAPPDGIRADFGTPSYGGDTFISDYHPPTRIPDHPFKVNRYYDTQDNEWKIRIREGRFYLTTNASPKVAVKPVLGPSDGTPLDVDNPEIEYIFQVTGDDGFPSFGNGAATEGGTPLTALPKEFTEPEALNGYCFIGHPDTSQTAWVYVRYVLKHNVNAKIDFAGIDNDLNVIVIEDSSIANATAGAVNKPINAAAVIDKDDADDPQIMRPDQTVAATLNGLAISGDREPYGVYYILLAKVEKIGTATGPLVTQYIHENITLSVTNVPVTAYSDGHGE